MKGLLASASLYPRLWSSYTSLHFWKSCSSTGLSWKHRWKCVIRLTLTCNSQHAQYGTRVCVKLNPRTAKSWSSAEARKCVKFCCTHFQSCKMIVVAFCLTHVITDITPNGISFSLLIESNFKDWEFCRDTLKHCVFIATTIRNLYNYRLYMYTTFPNFH